MFMIVTQQAAVHLGNNRLFGEFTFYQKSVTKNSKTIGGCDKEVGQGSQRNPRIFRGRLATKFLEKNHFVD